MNLTEGQLLFRLQDFHGAEQEALGIGDYEFFQESADIANALRELLQARRTIEELTAVVGQRNGECVRLHSLLDAAEKRIAELEAKLETADKLQDSAFRYGLKAGFSYGQTDDQSGFAQCMSAYSTHAGIKREGE